MAPSTLSRNTNRLILFIFSLLSLAYVANSLQHKELLKLKEQLRKAEENAAKMKFFHQAYRKATSSQELDEKMNQLHSSVERMKTSSWSGDFPPLVDLANSLSRFIDKTKVWLKKQDDSFAATVKENEKELENLKNVLRFLEEQNDEL